MKEEKPLTGTGLLSQPQKDPSRFKGARPRAESAGVVGSCRPGRLAWGFVWNLREHHLVVRTAMDTPWVCGETPHRSPVERMLQSDGKVSRWEESEGKQ